MGARVLVIDNYDSFVYNLVQYLGELGAEPVVHRHDAVTLDELRGLEPDAVLVSPGPGRPEDAGVSKDAIAATSASAGVPVLGVCLGHQCIGQLYGGDVVRAERVMHGKTSEVSHTGRRRVRRPRGAVHRDPLPLARRRRRDRPRLPRGDGRDGRRHRHGPAPPRVPDPGRAVPPRGDPHRRRPRPAAQLPRARPASTAVRGGGPCVPSTTARPSATSDASASASSSATATAGSVAQPRHHDARAAGGTIPRTRAGGRGPRRRADRASRSAAAAGTRRSAGDARPAHRRAEVHEREQPVAAVQPAPDARCSPPRPPARR